MMIVEYHHLIFFQLLFIIVVASFFLYAWYCYIYWQTTFEFRESKSNRNALPSLTRASLNMDYLRISYFQFLWGMLFIFPNAVILGCKGVGLLLIRRWLMKNGLSRLVSLKSHSVEATAAELILETALVTYFASLNDDKSIGTFTWHNLPAMTNEDTLVVFDEFSVLIDMKERRFIKGELISSGTEEQPHRRRNVSAQDTLNLLFWNLVGNVHVKIHSLANWGVVPTSKNDLLMRQYAVSTVLYNYFGYQSFGKVCALLFHLGLTESPFKTFKQAIDLGIDCGMHRHNNLQQMKGYSKLVYFILHARSLFMKLYNKSMMIPQEIKGEIVSEALFVGSVIHSLDHSQMEYVIQDVLWFEADDPFYTAMASQCRIVRAAFVDDLPFLTWHCKCKDSEHPFFHQLYEGTKAVDARLAECMDCCIIK
jgi:hypothetical protein